ncbi:DUF3558 domain-containing protein [Mycobacterium sp. 21AC1]|uniref:DUF3558 domain-containing protein n=1 Tax=[Mycobacterium] appelbergii TaxID=2939269 RepID=UPI00293920E1|nr:DUF3558 domain-containing protein [Mycobacterium sp. 21AC1]MDV3127640.1 DUF3558 domain-containing protein [Mycobacterium sp. 21AC1]
MSHRSSRLKRLAVGAAVGGALLAGCSTSEQPANPASPQPPGGGFHSADCNGVTDDDVAAAVDSSMFTKAVVNDTGCFWQENSVLGGTFGAGMGISTWWYRGSDLDTERSLEQRAGRTLTELSIDGNKGFKAADANVCSIYVAKGGDVITWSIQSMNPVELPDLCTITGQLAQLSQDRVN